MKKTIKCVFAVLVIVLLFTACLHDGNTPVVPKTSEQQTIDAEQQKIIDAEVDKVTLEVPSKANITAGELKQEDIASSGYDNSYAIKYETIKGNSENRKAEITFFLKKDGLISKKRTVTITGFKEKTSAPTGQELINAEADKVSVTVAGKETIFADELAANKNRITASGFDSAYTINYTVIKPDTAKREAEITFRLEKTSLHSKTRTITVKGFKEKVIDSGAADITENELLALFDLTENKIGASAAAKKIASGKGKTLESFIFEDAEAAAYDDEKGTFTVKVKGTKEGKPFEKEITVTGFFNPFTKIFPSLHEVKFDFSKAIELNKPLGSFISETNADIANVLKKLTFKDVTVGNIEMGTAENYRLTASLEENGSEIRIKPSYNVKHFKKQKGGNETSSEEDWSSVFHRLGKDLTKPYFSKNDVFMHLLGKTDNSIIKADPNKFASMYYALAKHLNITPDGLINDVEIKEIMKRYEQDGGHFKMKINTAIYQPKHGGIKADDYKGTAEIDYCIAEEEQIEQMLDGKHMNTPIKAIAKANASGFKKITKENAGDLFKFQIKLTADAQAQNTWNQKQLNNHPLLRSEYDSNLKKDVYKVNNPFKTAAAYYTVTVNGKDPEDVFALDNPKFFSKCADGADIFIEQISLNKERGSDKLNIHIQFTGSGKGISIEKQPE